MPSFLVSVDAAGHRLLTPHSRALEWVGADSYDEANNVGVDVFAVTAGSAAFESAVPTALRVLNEGYEPADDVSEAPGVLLSWGGPWMDEPRVWFQ